MNSDLLISAAWVVPVQPQGALENHSIVVNAGKITALLPTEEALQQFNPEVHLDCPQHILMPGLINAHTHAAMNLFRGYADDLPLHDWLNHHIWPAEARWLSESFVRDGTELAIAEMIRGGTTTFNDMYLFPDVTARCVQQAGMRASIGLVVIDFPTAWAKDADEYLHKGLTLADELRHDTLVRTTLAPHALYTVNDNMLKHIGVLSNELELPVHIHLQETGQEVEDCLAKYNKRPLEFMDEIGLVSHNLQAVHMTQTTSEDIALLKEHHSHVIHCPESNMKLASGACPVAELMDQGVNVALGTDSAASNDDLDMFGEMRTAALLGKHTIADASKVTAQQVLEMATLNGAKALGIADQTGSLEVGKSADMITVSLDSIETLPMYNPVSQLVYSCSRNNVTDVWVAGKQLLHNQKLTTLDEADLIVKAKSWQDKIASTAAGS
ncbi:MAG TPA: TRZ/ATZ family hydrolase [Chromatiales bacterium]|nr:TRZ/ATZ family hydrolase [Thiotrichales bacterium]HIP67547.1 TRZ/ATZ family hydrolase [Chromatiales bacterium]